MDGPEPWSPVEGGPSLPEAVPGTDVAGEALRPEKEARPWGSGAPRAGGEVAGPPPHWRAGDSGPRGGAVRPSVLRGGLSTWPPPPAAPRPQTLPKPCLWATALGRGAGMLGPIDSVGRPGSETGFLRRASHGAADPWGLRTRSSTLHNGFVSLTGRSGPPRRERHPRLPGLPRPEGNKGTVWGPPRAAGPRRRAAGRVAVPPRASSGRTAGGVRREGGRPVPQLRVWLPGRR